MPKGPPKSEATREFLRAHFSKTQFCSFYQLGKCLRGTACNYAHHGSEHRSRPDLTKTCMCVDWERGACPLTAAECKFAHGSEDLRSTSLRAPRGPLSTKVPLPHIAQGKQEAHKSHKVKFEKAGGMFEFFEDDSFQHMEQEPVTKHINSSPSVQAQIASMAPMATAGADSSMVTFQSARTHAMDSIPVLRANFTSESLGTITADPMQDLQAGHSISTLASINAFATSSIDILPATSAVSTRESLPDFISKNAYCA